MGPHEARESCGEGRPEREKDCCAFPWSMLDVNVHAEWLRLEAGAGVDVNLYYSIVEGRRAGLRSDTHETEFMSNCREGERIRSW